MIRRSVPFVMVDIAVIDDEEYLDIYDKMVFMVINRHAGNDDGKAWPSRKRIAAKCRCSIDRVDKSLKNLMKLGLIQKQARKKENGSNDSNVYYIPPVVSEIPVRGVAVESGHPQPVTSARVAVENDQGSRSERHELDSENYKQLTKDNNNSDLGDPSIPEEERAEEKRSVYNMFFQTFGKHPSPLQIEDLKFYMNAINEDALCYGLEKTAKTGAHFGYTTKIWDSWLDKKLFTLQDVMADEEKFEAAKKNRRQNNRGAKPNVTIPDWMKEESPKKESKEDVQKEPVKQVSGESFEGETEEERENRIWLENLLKQGK